MAERVVVAGLGAWGSAASYHLAAAGYEVIGLDQYRPPHDLGSSHGFTRVYRALCAESPATLEIAIRSREIFVQLQEQYKTELIREIGGLYIGYDDHGEVPGIVAGWQSKGSLYEQLTPLELKERHPAFELPDGLSVYHQPGDCVLFPERIISTLQLAARENGAELRSFERVLDWEQRGDKVAIRTEKTTLHADYFVITVGRWAAGLMQFALPVVPERQVSVWFETDGRPDLDDPIKLPIFVIATDTDQQFQYGVPGLSREGFKVAFNRGGYKGKPNDCSRVPRDAEIEAIREGVSRYIPALGAAPVIRAQCCWYTLVPDETYVLGWHPTTDRVAIAAACNSVGMKPAAAIGEALKDLIVGGKSRFDLSSYSPLRYASGSESPRSVGCVR